jgi:hypothetical protein
MPRSYPCLPIPAEDNSRMERDREAFKPRRSEKEQRRMRAELLYEFEMEARRQGFLADPAYVYDEEKDLFRFRDGKFAFSREHADWKLLKKRRRLKGFEAAW